MNGRVALPLDQSFGPRDLASNRREKSRIKQQMQHDATRGDHFPERCIHHGRGASRCFARDRSHRTSVSRHAGSHNMNP